MRRVVTGVVDGKSVFVSDEDAPRKEVFQHIPGLEVGALWATATKPDTPPASKDPTPDVKSWVAADGGTLFMWTVIPSSAKLNEAFQSGGADPAAAPGEMMQRLPGLAECYDPNAPGIHQTPTVDYVVVIKGELMLELDDEQRVTVKAGDVVVQNGTRHAWHNMTDEPAVIVSVMVGGPRG